MAPYNPQWLIALAKKQIPDKPIIILALSKCIEIKRESKAYFYFVDADQPNAPDSAWQFQESIQLEDEQHGTIILDVLKGNRIGGIEFLKYIEE